MGSSAGERKVGSWRRSTALTQMRDPSTGTIHWPNIVSLIMSVMLTMNPVFPVWGERSGVPLGASSACVRTGCVDPLSRSRTRWASFVCDGQTFLGHGTAEGWHVCPPFLLRPEGGSCGNSTGATGHHRLRVNQALGCTSPRVCEPSWRLLNRRNCVGSLERRDFRPPKLRAAMRGWPQSDEPAAAGKHRKPRFAFRESRPTGFSAL
jgi:hypothetical protein